VIGKLQAPHEYQQHYGNFPRSLAHIEKLLTSVNEGVLYCWSKGASKIVRLSWSNSKFFVVKTSREPLFSSASMGGSYMTILPTATTEV